MTDYDKFNPGDTVDLDGSACLPDTTVPPFTVIAVVEGNVKYFNNREENGVFLLVQRTDGQITYPYFWSSWRFTKLEE